MTKYVLACGDFHCGHIVGLTPPNWQGKILKNNTTKKNKFYRIAQEAWNKFDSSLKELPKLDVIIVNGDMVEGTGERSGGTELISTDREEQTSMAAFIINHIRKYGHKDTKVIATYGTASHVSPKGDDWENSVKDKAFIDKIGSHEWIDINGLIFDVKHHIGSSSTPYGRHTSPAKDGLWNDLWALAKMQPRADIILRSHVHYYSVCGTSQKLCMTLPALQGMGSKFGSRRCSGLVDWGFVLFRVKDKNDYNYYPYISQITSQKAKVFKV